jgi:hypothetical protein
MGRGRGSNGAPPLLAVESPARGPAAAGCGRGSPLLSADKPSQPGSATTPQQTFQARARTTQSKPLATPRSRRSSLDEVQLQPGFAWDAESLTLLYRWKTVKKRGTGIIIERGVFPGYDRASLDAAWAMHRVAAKHYYEEATDEGAD